MYIPTWLIIIVLVVLFIFWEKKKNRSINETPETVDSIEDKITFLKERIFSLEHFDSPHFIDYQNCFDTMEVNYLKIKQRFYHTTEKVLEISKDWHKYVEALYDLKHVRIMLDVDWSDNAWDTARDNSKEPEIIKEEIEKKFKTLLSKDFEKIPPNYFERMEKMEKPNEEDIKQFGNHDEWKYYYRDSNNLYKLEEKREKKNKEKQEQNNN